MSASGALPLKGGATVAGSAGHATPHKAVATPVPAKLGLGLLVALVVGSIIGSGLFGLPQNMAAGAGARAGGIGIWDWAGHEPGAVDPARGAAEPADPGRQRRGPDEAAGAT